MKATLRNRHAKPALKALAVAATLSCGIGASVAADATLSITSFTATVERFSGNYVGTLDAYQSLDMTALDAGGLNGADNASFADTDWDQGLNVTAMTGRATATGHTVQFTDPLTQLATGGFNLAATALSSSLPLGAPPNSADARAIHQGIFTLVDGELEPVSGTITFELYYEMSVAPPAGGWSFNTAQTTLSLDHSTDTTDAQTFADGVLSSGASGNISKNDGFYTWTVNLAAGESAYYTLGGSAIAQAVPEPGTYALMGLGLFAVASIAHRRKADRTDA